MIYLVLLAASVAIIFYVYKLFKAAGWITPPKIEVTESPSYIDKALTIFYKYNIGPYSNVSSLMCDAAKMGEGKGRSFGIYYSNPQTVPVHLLQSAAGVIVEESDETYEKDLLEAGYEKMILPKVSKSVEARQSFTGTLSIFALIYKTYPAIMEYVNQQKLDTSISMEIYEDDTVIVHFPLDHVEELFVPQYMDTDDLEAKLARKKFDSSEGESESEPEKEFDSQAEEAEIEVENSGAGDKPAGDKKDD